MATDLVSTPPQSLARDWKSIAALIDHTLIVADAIPEQVEQICREAIDYGFASVCAGPCHTALVAASLRGSRVSVGAQIGFPLGNALTTSKRFEAEEALRLGAQELDMVINLGALKSGRLKLVENDIRCVAETAHAAGARLKVVIETCLLTLQEKIVACQLALVAEADFVKTSTGFNGGGATVEDVHLMRGVVGDRTGVKASGGIRSAAQVFAMIEAGANRIGTRAGVAIVRELGAS
jgi:deoxyribose-phosphate aldolase